MSVREYIGARYVPIFGRKGEESIIWDSSKPYEPLTVVLYQGNSYTSRQFVPIGINITNEEFWAETGNYNAQVEQYRQEVLAFSGRLDRVEEATGKVTGVEIPAIKNDIAELGNRASTLESRVDKIEVEKIPQIIEDIERLLDAELKVTNCYADGTCILVECADAAICIDAGYTGDDTRISSFLSAHLGNRKLDAFIITHYHIDHIACVPTVLNFCSADTKIFVQMPCGASNSEKSEYDTNSETIARNIASKGFPNPIIATDGQEFLFGELKLTIRNTNLGNQSAYDNSWANSGSWDTRVSSLNNYSLISIFEYKGSTYVNTSDVEGAAEIANAAFMPKATIASVPHHISNRMGYCRFFDNLNPDYWLVTRVTNNASATDALNLLRDTSIMVTYIYRYIRFRNEALVFTNSGMEAGATLINGDVAKIYGNAFGKNLYYEYGVDADKKYQGRAIPITAILPPTYYNENPYILRKLKAKEILSACLAHDHIFEVYMQGSDAGTSFVDGMVFYDQMEKLFDVSHWAKKESYRVTVGHSHLQVEYNNWQLANNIAKIYSNSKLGYNDDGTTNDDFYTGVRMWNQNPSRVFYTLANGSIGKYITPDGTKVSTAEANSIYRSNRNIAVKVNNGTSTEWVPLVCFQNAFEQDADTPYNFAGSMPSYDNANCTYNVLIRFGIIRRCFMVNESTGEITNCTIDAVFGL